MTRYGYDMDKNLISQKAEIIGVRDSVRTTAFPNRITPEIQGNNVNISGKESFFYDKANNRIRRVTDTGEERYSYDVCNRLKEKTSMGIHGSRIQPEQSRGPIQSKTVGKQVQLPTKAQPGNITEQAAARPENRLQH